MNVNIEKSQQYISVIDFLYSVMQTLFLPLLTKTKKVETLEEKEIVFQGDFILFCVRIYFALDCIS